MLEINKSAELEQYLKERIDTLPYHELVRDIYVNESKSGKSLNVTIAPKGEVVCFDMLSFSLDNTGSNTQWKRRKKDAYSTLKSLRPKMTSEVSLQILTEAGDTLAAWRSGHPFTDEEKAFLASREAEAFFDAARRRTLRFLAEGELKIINTEITEKAAKVEFEDCPWKAVYGIASGSLSFSLVRADRLYNAFRLVQKEIRTLNGIERYLQEKGIDAAVTYAGKPGTFNILFRFEDGEEQETVIVGDSYKRIVLAAGKKAREKYDRRKSEKEHYLKECPVYGTFLAQAVLASIEENGNRLTERQIINNLRGVNISGDLTFGKYAGKYRLLPPSEISNTISAMEKHGIISEHFVRGDYRNYYVLSVTEDGKLFERLQQDTAPKKNPVTEQEYLLLMKAVSDDLSRISDRERQKILGAVADKPGIFLTEPEFVLDCMERMGAPAKDFLKRRYERERNKTGKEILKLLLNAAAGKGKEIPRNGVDSYRERKELERRRKEEERRKDRELFRLVLTEIPDNYIDLYPAARQMHRRFVLHIGPTNSGKTHDALEDLMRADSGIYLAPLRLLAYEQYERMNRAECPCSLVTGEEQFLIEGARHQSSTIEMLNLDKHYDVAVIDEAQMIADDARGGAWASAIMGVCADTVHVCAAPEAEACLIRVIRDCGDEYEIIRHKRMTPLVYEKKRFHFPDDVKPGDALIVFSRRNVHAVAAQLRRQRIKCSIIYGALPYDVRHRQAEMFAGGKTQVVVATDAIGMGMNLPIRRVVLMETVKYDGFVKRPLRLDEIRQIIGRAGRYGIYNVGFATAANGDESVRKALESRFQPIEYAVIDFPETLLTVDAPILDLIRKWEEVVPAEGWKKESVEQMRRLAEMTQGLNAPKRLAYEFLRIPFEDDDNELLEIWYDIFKKEVKGEDYSIYDRVAAMTLRKPSAADAIDVLEHQHRVLDLYYNLARKFQPRESTLEYILKKKRTCSEWIMKVLSTQGFKEKKCKNCGKILPWNYPYGVCSSCYEWGY